MIKKAYRQTNMEDALAFIDFPTPRIAFFVVCREPLFPRTLINIKLNLSSVSYQGRVKAEFPAHPTTRIHISSSSSSVKNKGATGAGTMERSKVPLASS